MKPDRSNFIRLSFAFLFVILAMGMIAQTSQTFSYTGGMQTFTVPTCVSTITVEVWGAEGSQAIHPIGGVNAGGRGGYATGVLTVTAGQVLNIFVGGAGTIGGSSTVPLGGGYNGGGNALLNGFINSAGGGGGASDIRVGGTALTDRRIVGGGGGGATQYLGCVGGHAGGLVASQGGSLFPNVPGLPGTQSAAGAWGGALGQGG